MEESEDNMSSEDVRKPDSPLAVRKQKKRSMIERELETNMTARVTSPVVIGEGSSTSRYGRARRLKTDTELIESQKVLLASIKSPGNENTPVKIQSPVYRMHASNSPNKAETPKKSVGTTLDNQIENIYQENISLSRFSAETGTPSPAKKFPKVYIRKDLLQSKDDDEPVMLIKNLFSPSESASKPSSARRTSDRQLSSEKYNGKQNGHVDNSSVVKTLDFDGNKKKNKEGGEQKSGLSKSELFELEAKCPYQVGDLAWARMGTFPFWPCIITRDPNTDMFVKKKPAGRVEHEIVHVTFLGDNGRRSWVGARMLRAQRGRAEFEAERDRFTPEDKKKDPKLYAAFFVSEKKQGSWNLSVEEAEILLREPKRLRIDVFNEMLWNSRAAKTPRKSGKITRTDSDVSLSESLYDSLFSDKEDKVDDAEGIKKARNKSFDVSEVVTACLDNMAAKTGITKIQRQSHMDRWLQKAKSKTPEKTQAKPVPVLKLDKPEKVKKSSPPIKLKRRSYPSAPSVPASNARPYSFRKRSESNTKSTQNVPTQSTNQSNDNGVITNSEKLCSTDPECIVVNDTANQGSTVIISDNDEDNVQLKNEPTEETTSVPNRSAAETSETSLVNDKFSDKKVVNITIADNLNKLDKQADVEKNTDEDNSKNMKILMPKSIKPITDHPEIVKSDNVVKNNEIHLKAKLPLVKSLEQSNTDKLSASKSAQKPDVSSKDLNEISANTDSIISKNGKISKSDKKTSFIPMDVDEDVKEGGDPDFQDNTNNSAMDVDVSTNCEKQVNGNSNFKIVSNECVENNSVIDFKEAQNVTIEVSVTEKNQDETLNNQQEEEEEKSITIDTPQQTQPKFETGHFLDPRETEKIGMGVKNDTIVPRNSSTPVKIDSLETKNIKANSVSKKLNLESDINCLDSFPNDKELVKQKKDTNNFSNEEEGDRKNKIANVENDEEGMNESNIDTLNESINSVSILRYSDDHGIEKGDSIMETSLNESFQSESILESSQINESNNHEILIEKDDVNVRKDVQYIENKSDKMEVNHQCVESPSFSVENTVHNVTRTANYVEDKNEDEVAPHPHVESPTFTQLLDTDYNCSTDNIVGNVNKTADNTVDNVNFTANYGEDKNDDEVTTRPYVESPTFTQLLDSEEFFRDVNETSNARLASCPKTYDKTIDKVDHHKDIISDQVFDDSDDLSEDEPSPEYETLDDEITEDFRKHMKSIESTIKDKKNEEQIVKICNEIAEKAKYSPTKYNQEEDIKLNKINADSNNVPAKVKNSQDVGMQRNDTTKKERNNNCQLKEQQIEISVRNHNKTLHTSKRLNKKNVDKVPNVHTKIDILKEILPQKQEDKISAKDSLKMNGNAAPHEILGKSKIYKTRSSISSTKNRTSSECKIESSKVEKYRNSSEYEPKVVLMRLERDEIDNSLGKGKLKSLDLDTVQYQDESQKSLCDSPDNKHIQNKTINLEEHDTDPKHIEKDSVKSKNIKTRLSLKRNSPKNKQIENKIVHHSPAIKVNKIEKNTSETLMTEEIILDKTDMPKKTDIVNEKCLTVPEPMKPEKVNGYRHEIDRKFTDTPDPVEDTDFDVDAVSLNSEDSEVSLPHSIEAVPKRKLRARPEQTLKYALQNPEFLKYLELRQDYLMELHPELNEDEVVNYIHKTWKYEEDLKCDSKKEDVRTPKQETPSRSKKSKNTQPKNTIEYHFREKFEMSRKNINFNTEVSPEGISTESVERKTENGKMLSNPTEVIEKKVEISVDVEKAVEKVENPANFEKSVEKIESPVKRKKSVEHIDLTSNNSNAEFVKTEDKVDTADKPEESLTPRRSVRSKLTPKSLDKDIDHEDKHLLDKKLKNDQQVDNDSVDSEDSEIPLRQLRSRVSKENKVSGVKEIDLENKADEPTVDKPAVDSKDDDEEKEETISTVSDNEPLVKQVKKKTSKESTQDPEFIQYLERKQDALMDENPQLSHDEIVQYLHKTWVYEQNSKSELEKNDELEQQASSVKGLNNNEVAPPKKVRRKPKVEKVDESEVAPKEKPKRRIAQPFYNENYSDIEDELEVYEIFKNKKTAITAVSKTDADKQKSPSKAGKEEPSKDMSANEESLTSANNEPQTDTEYVDEIEWYFAQLTQTKPNVFKGLIRERVCEICECTGNLVKCKGCYGTFHPECVRKQIEIKHEKDSPVSGKIKKKRGRTRKLKVEDEGHSDEKSLVSADSSMEDIVRPETTVDAEFFESQLEVKMKEMIKAADVNYDSYSSDDGITWTDTVAGKCEIVDVKLKRRDPPTDYTDFKCNDCHKNEQPLCFVCKSAVSKTDVKVRQKCHVAHCHKYYHVECLDHWPQTQFQFNSGEPSRNNKKKNEFFEALTCPRHVCHTCVSDDPRGCKTRFSGDKLAKCVRCPATYHSFNKCLPAGSQILTASHIICPRHSEQRAGKVPCHVNTGWCFICAQGGSLICCEYCPTSFHAECLNIKPPEGNYMCEDCETGRLPLYGEMVWVKLGQYRWWPGIILHPAEIPGNIMSARHELGDFVVRFFGQYDHYWVNRGRVFPYQEGDSGRISSQKSKINEDFICAIEHAQRAYNILKKAVPDEEESLDIASSLLPPHYVKLKCNKPSGALCGRRMEDPSLSLTQCECDPAQPEPCGPYSQCLNRMLLTECGPSCRAGERCNNRAFERRQYPRLAPYRTPARGWGLRALQNIKAGQFVIEYVGELIDEAEFRRRMRRKHEVRDENFYFLTLDKERVIDAGPKGNVARFMNHCCEPNCETQKWTVLGDVRVGLFAIDDIPANSELTFNYNLECAGIEKKRCLCGARRCSGYIGAKPKQDDSQSKKGKDGKMKRSCGRKKKVEESPSTNKQKKRLGRPPKPRELSELEKDVLIIKNATNTSSDESTKPDQTDKPTKRKRTSNSTEQDSTSNNQDDKKSLKRKRAPNSTDEVSIYNGPEMKRIKCDKPSEVGD